MSLESLLGVESSGVVSLLGVLSRNPSNANEFVLEDGEGMVVVDLSSSVVMVVLVDVRSSVAVTSARAWCCCW